MYIVSCSPIDDAGVAKRAALVCWCIVLCVVAGRIVVAKNVNHTVFQIYQEGGRNWIDGAPVYGDPLKDFRYSPTAAAAFAPWALLPSRLGEIAWRAFGVCALVCSMLYFFNVCAPNLSAARRWWIVLGSLPLSVLSVNNGQVNVLLGALLLAAPADARRQRWNRCAVFLAAATLIKPWALAYAGLLIACFPKTLGTRFTLALLGGLLAPFVLQRPEYVLEAYRGWFVDLQFDTRFAIDLEYSKRDFWLVNRLVGEPVSQLGYALLQAASGTSLALWLAALKRRGVATCELVRAMVFGGTIWVLGFGPSTESCTYSLIAPILAWAMFDPSRRRETRLERWLLLLSIAFFAVALAGQTTPHSRLIQAFGWQPLGAALLFGRMLVAGRPIREPTASRLESPQA
jgi:hypothetical protein